MATKESLLKIGSGFICVLCGFLLGFVAGGFTFYLTLVRTLYDVGITP